MSPQDREKESCPTGVNKPTSSNLETVEQMKQWADSLGVEHKLQPYQHEMLNMIDSVPEGAEIKINLGLRRGPRVFAVKDGVTYCYRGNRKWTAI